MEKNKHRGILVISYEQLHTLLNLDDDYTILDITADEKDREEEKVKIKLSGPILHQTLPGCPLVYFSRHNIEPLLKKMRKK